MSDNKEEEKDEDLIETNVTGNCENIQLSRGNYGFLLCLFKMFKMYTAFRNTKHSRPKIRDPPSYLTYTIIVLCLR